MSSVIVHVDDDEDIRFAVSTVLTGAGYKVQSFASMESLRKALDTLDPALFILDVMVDKVDSGLEMHEELKKRCPSIPKMLMTSLDEQVSMSVEDSATSVFYKPVNPQALLDMVGRLAGKPNA